jgi:protein-L-isoaspartate O-methyltransferase
MNALRRLVGQGPPASQRQLVDHLVRRGALSQAGSRAYNVMQRIDRARFVDAGAQAYKASFRTARFISARFCCAANRALHIPPQDAPLPIGYGQTISAPHMVRAV